MEKQQTTFLSPQAGLNIVISQRRITFLYDRKADDGRDGDKGELFSETRRFKGQQLNP